MNSMKMKCIKISLLIVSALSVNFSFAQWKEDANGIYPTSLDKAVGIGTVTPKAALDVNVDIRNGQIGTIFGIMPEGNSVGNGTFLGVVGYSTQLADYSGKGFALEHHFYGETNSSINFYRGGNTKGGFITFNTNDNTEKMRILANGNVGIGTTTPTEKLDVVGSIRSTINSDEGGYIALSNPSKTGTNDAAIWRIFNMSGGYGNSLQFWGYSNTVNLGPKLTIKDNGNVGIGTSDPDLANHIIGKSGFPATSGTSQVGILRLQGSESNGVLDFSVNAGSGATLQVTNRINLAANYSLILNPNGGNVGIGTTTPTEKLSVNGNIKAKKLIVTQTGWADYVFDKNYTLMPVDSLSTYINTHKHLPEMPTTKDVQDNGVDVGNNQTLLLKKIEELTLYIIEQHKQLAQQNERIQKLEKSKN